MRPARRRRRSVDPSICTTTTWLSLGAALMDFTFDTARRISQTDYPVLPNSTPYHRGRKTL